MKKNKLNIEEELNIGDLLIPKGKSPLLVIDRIPTRRFEFTEYPSNKFWEIFLRGKKFTTRWGKINTEGTSQTKRFLSEQEVLKAYSKLIEEKIGKGYNEIISDKLYTYIFHDICKTDNSLDKNNEFWISSVDLKSYIKKYNVTLLHKK